MYDTNFRKFRQFEIPSLFTVIDSYKLYDEYKSI